MRTAFGRQNDLGLVISATLLLLAVVALSSCGTPEPEQTAGDGAAAPAATSGPAPRTVWGESDLTGIWMGGGTWNGRTNNLAELEKLYRPEVYEQMKKVSDEDDPLLRCVPYGMPRGVLSSPWPFQIVQAPGVAVLMTEYYHAYRVIPTDGSPHTEGMYPTHFGDSVGRWEGDTLVVDVVGFNGKTWLSDRDKPSPASPGNWPTSDAMHQIERWRRVDADTLEFQVTVEDPTMLTGTWTTPVVLFKRAPEGTRLGEAVCLDTTTYELAKEK
jgi:hypothetical protein